MASVEFMSSRTSLTYQVEAHQKHITNLINSSTLFDTAPMSPYTRSLTLGQPSIHGTSRRGQLARAANSPFGGRVFSAGTTTLVDKGETPTKKKKSRVQQLGARDDDDMSIVGGKARPAPKKRRV